NDDARTFLSERYSRGATDACEGSCDQNNWLIHCATPGLKFGASTGGIRPLRSSTSRVRAAAGPDSDELSEPCGLVGVNHYGRALITQSPPHRLRALELLARNRRRSVPWAPRSA